MKRCAASLLCIIGILGSLLTPAFAAGTEDIWDGSAAEGFAAGSGTEADPYRIQTPEELRYLLSQNQMEYEGRYFQLEADLYMNDPACFARDEDGVITGVAQGASPIPWDAGWRKFGGTLDGNGHTIFGLYINGGYALISEVTEDGAVMNLHVEDAYTADGNLYAALVRDNYGRIEHCSFEGTVLSSSYGGGMACNNYGLIAECTVRGKVDSQICGGICSHNSGVVRDCRNEADIIGDSYTGGVVGWNYEGGVVTNCMNLGDVSTGKSMMGGVCGYNSGILAGCGNLGAVTSGGWPGGVCGAMSDETAYAVGCWNGGSVTATGYDEGGGVCAYLYPDATLACCYNYGACTNGGGVAGTNSYSTILDCRYDSALVSSINNLGTASDTAEIQSPAYIEACNAYIDASPLEGLVYWVADSGNSNSGYPVTAGAEDTYQVRVTVEGRGTAVPALDFAVLEGHSRTITFAADYGYELRQVLVNGAAQPVENRLALDRDSTGTVEVTAIFGPDGSVAESFHGGTGTQEDPYQITTMAEFAYLAQRVNDGWETRNVYFQVMNDITFNDASCFARDADGHITGVAEGVEPRTWIPIGTSRNQFEGVLDGGGHTVTGLYIEWDQRESGLVGYAGSWAQIRNLTLQDGYLGCPEGWVGAFAGQIGGPVGNCHNVNVTILGGAYTGGIVGDGGDVTGCTNSGNLLTSSGMGGGMGGIAGYAGVIDGCVNTSGGSVWYQAGMTWAMANDISDGTNPDSSVTREQLAVMLYRYVGSPAVSGKVTGFTDAGAISSWAEDGMAWAIEQGLITGLGDGTVAPQKVATRCEVATILMRFDQMYGG